MIPITLCILSHLDGLLHATPTKELTNTLLYVVMLDDPHLTLLENNDQDK